MKSKSSSEDLNLIALAKLRELIDLDNELLPAWKTGILRVLKNAVPEDVAPLENLIRGEGNDPTKGS